jgi:hypothetical protein
MKIQPPANCFRVGDRWRATNGLLYLVRPGSTHGLVLLQPIRSRGEKPVQVHVAEVNSFGRVSWGGRP